MNVEFMLSDVVVSSPFEAKRERRVVAVTTGKVGR
jgi:hypothetical protein